MAASDDLEGKRGKRLGQHEGFVAEANADLVVDDVDMVDGESADRCWPLGVEQDKQSGEPVFGAPPTVGNESEEPPPATASQDGKVLHRETIAAHAERPHSKPRTRSRIAALAPTALLAIATWLAGSIWADASYDVDHADGRFGMEVANGQFVSWYPPSSIPGPPYGRSGCP